MKRFIYTALLCIAFVMPTQAQDAISYGYPCYMFNYVDTNNFLLGEHGPTVSFVRSIYHTAGAYRYVMPENETISVHGIAITAIMSKDNTDSGEYTVYMYTVGDNNRLVCIDSATKYSVVTDFRYWGHVYNNGQYRDTVVACYEYYFSQPHVILDSTIYVGTRWSMSDIYGDLIVGIANNISNAVPIIDMESDTLRYHAGTQYSNWGGIFPIIKRGCDSCPEVHDVRFTKVGNSAALAQWNVGDNHQDWQLCYGPQGFNPDSGQAMTTVAPQMAIGNLSPTAQYDVYIKARCHCCSTDEWTPWAGPYSLCLRDIGIDEAAAPEVTLSPNPTTGKLTVGCEAAIEEVEMYDMQGRMISGKWKEESGKCAVLDLAGLPAGSYILVAHTTKGVATRTVEKR